MTPSGLEKASDFFEITYYRPVSDAKSDAEIKAILQGGLSDASFGHLFAIWCFLGPEQKEELLALGSNFAESGGPA